MKRHAGRIDYSEQKQRSTPFHSMGKRRAPMDAYMRLSLTLVEKLAGRGQWI